MISKYKYFLVLFLFFNQKISVFAMYDRQCPIEFDSEKLLKEMDTKSFIKEQKKLNLPKSKIKSESIDIPVNKTLKELTGVNSYIDLKEIFSGEKSALIELTKTVLDLSTKNEIAFLNIKDNWVDPDSYINLDWENLKDADFDYIKKGFITESDKVIILGDLHGNFEAFDQIIKDLINKNILGQDLILQKDYQIIALGDYVDRGLNSLNIVLTLMILRIINGESVIFLKGNHEDAQAITQEDYDFSDELNKKLGQNAQNFYNFFKLLPVAYFAKNSKAQLFMFNHGGWSSNLIKVEDFFKSDKYFKKINQFLARALCWNDTNYASKNREEIRISLRGSNIYEIPYQIVLCGMIKLGIAAKFNGHMHMEPKGNPKTDEYEDLIYYPSPGFVSKNSVTDENTKIYTLISGAIEIYNKNKVKVDSETLNYFPSYLILNFNKFGYCVSGYYKKYDNNYFTKTEVRSWDNCWEYRFF